MSTFRAISTDDYNPIDHVIDPGPAPMLEWLPIAKLIVDPAYQRDVSLHGRKNVRKIAGAFEWRKFGTVIVAPLEGGSYAIVDGQHRTTAAALIGIEHVPCQIIVATRAEQAAAFREINGTITRMSRAQIYVASLAAGDAEALAVADVCARAEVEVLRGNPSWDKLKPCQTIAIAAIENLLKKFGRDVLVSALQCITQTANREVPGLLRGPIITALCVALARNEAALNAGERLLEVFDDIEIEREFETARLARKERGTSVTAVLADYFGERLNGIH